MDGVTHAALGALVGEWLLGRKLGNRALALGAVVGLLPELDVLLVPFVDQARWLDWRDSVTHSLLMVALVPVFLGRWLAKRLAKPKLSAGALGWPMAAILVTHILADCLGVRGVKICAPFWWEPVGFAVLSDFEPLFTLPVLLGVGLTLRARRKVPQTDRKKAAARPESRKGLWWGLGMATAVALMALGAKMLVAEGFDRDLARRGVMAEARAETPTPGNFFVWRSIVRSGDALRVGYRSVFESFSRPVFWTVVPRCGAAFDPFRDMQEARAINRSTRGWWVARQTADGAWIADLRANEAREWKPDGAVDWRAGRAWSLVPRAAHDKLVPREPETVNRTETAWRLVQRAICVEGCWDGPARLTGVRGSFPISLETVR